MSFISKTPPSLAGIALLLSGCLPGPWDYKPEHTPGFKGLTLSAYAVAGRPVENVCIERLLALSEASTDARPFHDSASVGISGTFSDNSQTLALQPKARSANCFEGDTAARFVAGESYTLSARIVWSRCENFASGSWANELKSMLSASTTWCATSSCRRPSGLLAAAL
jgi:hypothetical protein